MAAYITNVTFDQNYLNNFRNDTKYRTAYKAGHFYLANIYSLTVNNTVFKPYTTANIAVLEEEMGENSKAGQIASSLYTLLLSTGQSANITFIDTTYKMRNSFN